MKKQLKLKMKREECVRARRHRAKGHQEVTRLTLNSSTSSSCKEQPRTVMWGAGWWA